MHTASGVKVTSNNKGVPLLKTQQADLKESELPEALERVGLATEYAESDHPIQYKKSMSILKSN